MPWHQQGQANGIDPTYWADFVRWLYAYKTNPIRAASVLNQAYYDKINQATMDGHLIKQHHVIGGDYGNLILSFTNKYLVANTGDTNTGNSFTIQDMVIVNAAGTVVVPVYFSGSRTKVIADGDTDIQSDPVYPSSFGLTKFSKDEEYYIKGRVTGSVNFYVPFGQNRYLYQLLTRSGGTIQRPQHHLLQTHQVIIQLLLGWQ